MRQPYRAYGVFLKHIALALFVILVSLILVSNVATACSPVHTSNAEHYLVPTDQTDENLLHDAPSYGVSWLALAFINAGLAQGKNRRGLNWFLISIFLGPFATFLLVTFFPKKPSPTNTTPHT